jgi:hypothetical protein
MMLHQNRWLSRVEVCFTRCLLERCFMLQAGQRQELIYMHARFGSLQSIHSHCSSLETRHGNCNEEGREHDWRFCRFRDIARLRKKDKQVECLKIEAVHLPLHFSMFPGTTFIKTFENCAVVFFQATMIQR